MMADVKFLTCNVGSVGSSPALSSLHYTCSLEVHTSMCDITSHNTIRSPS